MPSMNSCRVIFPSWSLSMRRKKSMTRDFLWFIQRIYFFRQTSKSKFANSFNWKETPDSQWGKSPREQHPQPHSPLKDQPSGQPAPELRRPPLTPRPPGKINLGSSRRPPVNEGAAQMAFQEQKDTQRSQQPPRGTVRDRTIDMGCSIPTQAEYQLRAHRQLPPPLALLGRLGRFLTRVLPDDSPGSAQEDNPLLASFWAWAALSFAL